MFSWLDHRVVDWSGHRVLDLYAGSGALALEAISRGANGAVVVERDRQALAVIKRNIEELAAGESVVVRAGAVRAVASQAPVPCGLVFADPPYDVSSDEIADALADYLAHGWISDEALVVVETGSRAPSPWPEGIAGLQRRAYGDTAIWYGHRHVAAPGDEEE